MAEVGGTKQQDERRLAELGYKQELDRGWTRFTNFAISFSIISVLAGCFTTFYVGWNNGGPIVISIGWPVIAVIILPLPGSMSQLAPALPPPGGAYWGGPKPGGARGAGVTRRVYRLRL